MDDEPRTRRMVRPALALAALTLAGSTAFLTWWTTTLSGLPDVGDPFDVTAFERPIPDETNAFVLYRKAVEILPPEPDIPSNTDWEAAGPAQRAWFEKARPALRAWREGTERPDSCYVAPRAITFGTKLGVAQSLRSLTRAALLEASRLEAQGDLAGSLGWTLAVLRSSRHCGRRGTLIERLIGMAIHRAAADRLIRWAADPRVDAALIRRALDAALAADRATPPISDALKMEYLSSLHSIADPALMDTVYRDRGSPAGAAGSSTLFGLDGWKSSWTRVRRRAIHDPERSRRVLRMIFANWLAYADLPPDRRPPKVLPSASPGPTGPAAVLLRDLYAVGDDAPAAARALDPAKLAAWYATTVDAWTVLPSCSAVEKALARERSMQGTLLVALANELHEREHGRYPEQVEDLVGPYLPALPPGYQPARSTPPGPEGRSP